LFISRLVRLELRGALERKLREGILTAERARQAWATFQEHEEYDYRILSIDEAILRNAEELLTRRQPLRAADAIHIATAISAQPPWDSPDFIFVTVDRRQASAAEAEGLTVQLIE
jgi:predicted nucleic acid-binding protein